MSRVLKNSVFSTLLLFWRICPRPLSVHRLLLVQPGTSVTLETGDMGNTRPHLDVSSGPR